MKDKINDTEKAASNVIQRNFEIAVQLVKSLPQKGSFQPSYSEAGKIYSYFKQAKFGPCTQPRPGFWDVVSRAKWDAWSALGDMSQEVAMKHYVEEIKQVYSRIKQIEEFEERQEEFADVLIPFCKAANIPLSAKLLKLSKTQETTDRAPSKNGTPMDGTPVNGTNSNGTPRNSTPGDRTPLNGVGAHLPDGMNNSTSSVHSVMMEQMNKNDVFNDDRDKQAEDELHLAVEDAQNGSGSEDDEVYCDSIDPDQVISFSSSVNGQPTNINGTPEKKSQSNLQNTSTPYAREQNPTNTEYKTSTSSESKSDFEVVTGNPNDTTDLQSIPKKDFEKRNTSTESANRKQNSSSDSCKTFNLLNELQKPCKNRKQKDVRKKTTTTENSRSDRMRQTSVRSHKRDGQPPSERTSEQKSQGGSNSVNGGNDVYQSSQHHRHSRHRHPSNSNHDDTDDDTCSTISSSSSDNVGLKIVQALERMEENLHDVLDRLDSIEGTMKTLTQPATPWWRNYVPSNTALFWAMWPVMVNLICFYFWRKKRRQRLQKC